MCPGVLASNNSKEGTCPNLTLISINDQWVWSSYPVENNAIHVKLNVGKIYGTGYHSRGNSSSIGAFCK